MKFIFLFINLTTCVIVTITILYMFGDYYFNKNKKLSFPLTFILIITVVFYSAGLVFTHYIANTYFATEIIKNSGFPQNKLENPGLLGDSAGLINALFSALILGGAIYTLNLQRKEIDANQKDNALEKFENKFYEMIRLHKQNVDEIIIDNFKGRRAIEQLFLNFSEIFKNVENAIEQIEKSTPTNDPKEIERFNRLTIYLSDDKNKAQYIHELSYGYFFYGIENYFLTRDSTSVRYELNVDITIRLKQLSIPTPSNSLLGHYFRHLYQTVQIVANETIISEEAKNKYTKLIRAQLSDFEQALLYYNSLSIMGSKWITPLGEHSIEKMCLIARFRLIKNIPYYFKYFGVLPKKLFETEINTWEKQGSSFFELDM